jgi:4-amino-4-deoxy-L-arabinose transferase-like glycosyltransferase
MKKGILIFIMIIAFILRLYRINNPLADWHSWRQADTSAVSRNFIKMGFDLLHPRFDDLSNVASGKENPQGFRFVEFPFYNLLQAGSYKLFPFLSLEVWGRLVSIIFSLVSLYLLYLIVKTLSGEVIALWAAFFFAVLPFNIYYNRVILPESLMVTATLAVLYFFLSGTQERDSIIRLFFSFTFLSISLLIKPFSLVFLLPLVYLGWRRWQFRASKWAFFALALLLSCLPFLAWRLWMSQFPEGIPGFEQLFNENGIRLKGAWFYWLFAERLGKLILGYWGILFLGLGLIERQTKKEGWFYFSWLLGILSYLVIVAAGNVRHDYYQIITIPIICVFLAKGAYFLFSNKRLSLLLICLLFMLAFSWYHVRDFYNINNSVMIEAARAADRLLPKEAKVIAPLGGDTAFLYHTQRQGWPVGIEIEKMISLGAQYYVNFNFNPETDWLEQAYCVLEKTPQWVIIDLTCQK